MVRRFALLSAVIGSLAFPTATQAQQNADMAAQEFQAWLQTVRTEASQKGVSNQTLDEALANLKPIDRVLELDKRQPEFTRTFWDYIGRAVSPDRIERGRKLLRQHADLFRDVYARNGVQGRFLVAFWGLETNFGDHTGGFPVIGALATLAHDPRRSDFFRAELMNALTILDHKHITLDRMEGSWAGAMGQTQFMPSTFVRYAKDGDGDKKIDIWGSLPDVMESASNYLSSVGWKRDETWGREVRLPKGFDLDLVDLDIRHSLSEWQKMGVRRADGGNLPIVAGMKASLVLPAGYKGPAFLVYNNFNKIMVWNRSIYYAIAVGHLADRIAGKPAISVKRPANDKAISRTKVIEMQTALNELGYDVGKPDGIMGSRTRGAIKDYQRATGLPADGYATISLIEQLQKAVQ
ncbi:lytic murein transglycosylase [Aestuariispira ectoiniformans]|uniref:lytic murein transglycosylase n=1 Tax=Aestuariispira ectoiniformans TaxID=2775080 RepID=UPI00223ADC03|nr:lytic murein transglycosylase [Aestuariispira ectoiniformans]